MSFDNFFDEPKFDYESEKKKFIENLNFLKSMSVQEITLYKKWEEFNKDSYSMLQKASKFDGLEKSIWVPKDRGSKATLTPVPKIPVLEVPTHPEIIVNKIKNFIKLSFIFKT